MTVAPDNHSAIAELLTGNTTTGTALGWAHQLNLLRADNGSTKVRRATRSSMLWALMAVDNEVADIFGRAGVSLDAWTEKLELSESPTRIQKRLLAADDGTTTPALDPDLAVALDRNLEQHRHDPDEPVSTAQLALAVLDSLDDGTSKVLPRRLSELRFDRAAAYEELRTLVESQGPTETVALDDFSVSVRNAISTVGLTSEVTPSDFAAELARLHPTYAGGRLGAVDFTGDDTIPYPLVDLLATVRHVAAELEPGEVINTREVLLALCYFDHVRAALESNGAYEELLIELGRSPGDAEATEAILPPPATDRPTLDMLADIPIDDPEFDVMNFGPYVEAVVQLIENPRTTTPLSIAVNGPWGSGKTSLGRMVETRLSEEQEDRLVPIITWFNAWLHDSADDLGAALTAHVGRELNPHRRPLRRFLQLLPKNMLTARQRYLRKLWVAGLGLLIAVSVAYGWVRITTDGIVDGTEETTETADGAATEASDDGEDSVAGAAAEGGASAALVLAILAAASRFVDPARSAAAFIASPRSEAQEGALTEARKEIGSLLNQAGVPTARSMVIFVDDLERSRPPSAIDICEVANQLLDHPGVFIVYLADMAKIASTVEIKYKDYARWAAPTQPSAAVGTAVDSEEADDDAENGDRPDRDPHVAHHGNGWWGRAYMEKMVQIQIDIPELERAAGSHLLRLITAQSRAAADRRQDEERLGNQFSWLATIARPIAAVTGWFEDRRKRTLVERLYRLVDENSDGGEIDVQAVETEARQKGFDDELVGRVIRRTTEVSETYRAAEKVAVAYLPNNPRAIKRLANRLRFESEVADELSRLFRLQSSTDPRLVGKWAVLTTRWPALAEALKAGRVDLADLEKLKPKELPDQLQPYVRPGVAGHEMAHLAQLLTDEPRFGPAIDQFLYHRLAPVDANETANVTTTGEPPRPEPTHPS